MSLSARRSSRLLSDYGFDSRSSVLVTDGLDGVKILPGDIIVIAGMGGLNIIDILTRMTASADARVLPKIAIVLQSQKSANLVREFVCAKGFDIQGESVCNDRNLYYSIMRLTYTGESTKLSDKELYYGPRLLEQQGDETVRKYFRHLDEVYAVRSRSDKRYKSAYRRENCQCRLKMLPDYFGVSCWQSPWYDNPGLHAE